MPHNRKPMDKIFAEVVFDLPIDKTFIYNLPLSLVPSAKVKPSAYTGRRVLAPFGRRRLVGYIVAILNKTDMEGVRDIIDIIDEKPIFDSKRLSLYRWISSYYLSSLGEVIKTAHSGEPQPKEKREFYITPAGRDYIKQKKADGILGFIEKKGKTSITALNRHFKKVGVHAALNLLKMKGFIEEKCYIKESGKVSKKAFAVYAGKDRDKALNESSQNDPAISEIDKRATKQKAILNRLVLEGEAPLDKLKEYFPNPYGALKKLEEKGFVRIVYRETFKGVLNAPLPAHSGRLGSAQEAALKEITNALSKKAQRSFLLFGVTGSGKTEVYLRAISRCLKLGRKVLFLAPEIALASRLSRFILSRFKKVALLHSGITTSEKISQWAMIKRGEVDIVAGARSAIFAPLKDIGLIIVDEEHDSSYKQEDGIRYNARDLALLIGKLNSCVVVLGSATPSLESYNNCTNGKLTCIELSKRVENRDLPNITIVDMREEKDRILSEKLLKAMGDRIEKGEQVILFLNRKGFSPFILCKDCGHVCRCPNCLISLTFHKEKRLLRCHYCGHIERRPIKCKNCDGNKIFPIGTGIERLTEEVRKFYPDANIKNMDRDTARRKNRVWEDFEDGKIDILIGTQIVTKGYHFPNTTLVGIVSADQSLNIPDFRAGERTFQLLTQAAGRAGRGNIPGEVIIQTYNPDHYCFEKVKNHDYKDFFINECTLRKETGYPPFSRLANIVWEGEDHEEVSKNALNFKEKTVKAAARDRGIRLLGPAPAFYAMLRKKHRWQMLIKGDSHKSLHGFLEKALKDYKAIRGVKMTIDIDPVNLL